MYLKETRLFETLKQVQSDTLSRVFYLNRSVGSFLPAF
jgi:hypothetical protein